jgi:hypothetical protein
MANTTKRGNVGATPFDSACELRGAVSTAQTFWENAMVGLTAAGYLDKFDDAADKRFDGRTEGISLEVPSGGSNGDILIPTDQPRFITCAIAAATVADIGRLVYASDDQAVAFTPGAFGNPVGRIAAVRSATSVVVACKYHGELTGGRPLQVASADGAVVIKSGTEIITKAGVCALTLANPTSGVHDGVEMTFLSATAHAHTITNAGGINGAGASGDVATFGAAKGNSITLVAYLGVWYVKNLTGVTLA